MQDATYHQNLLKGIYGGRDWVLASGVLASAAFMARHLKALGARKALCVADHRGVGDPPDPDFAPNPMVLDGERANSMMDGIRQATAKLQDPSEALLAHVDSFDPEGVTRTIGPISAPGPFMAGRPLYGHRADAWQRLEDKTLIHEVWEAANVHQAPHETVPATLTALRGAASRLDRGMGTVWVGDNREGWHGGAALLRWVRDERDAEQAQAFLAQQCDTVRVMPFLDGIPCSIHGLVFDTRTIVFRPCEMIVLRQPGKSTLHYARAATFWDPPQADRDDMRAAARRVGDHLRERVGYRGVFTMDGVMSAEGFRPTELNPRFGAAAGLLLGGLPDLPLYLLHLAVIEGEDVDWRPDELEALVLASADAHRSGSGMALVTRTIHEEHKAALSYDPATGRCHPTPEGQDDDLRLYLGPAVTGGYLSARLNPTRTPVGLSSAPRVAAALQWADAHWSLGIGPLAPAPDLRR